MKISFALLLSITLVACSSPPSVVDPVPLDVADRTDATPWVAASGAFVAVTWGATANGKADVFIATSRDGGATFTPPVQVNTIAGEARLGAELPPRVSLVERDGRRTPDVVVLWTARGAATEIKAARSNDGGRTFDPAVVLQSTAAPGDRGWPAMTVDERGTVHAVWLDHRGVAAAGGSGHHHSKKTDAGYDGVAMAQKSGLFYASIDAASVSAERPIAAGVCYCCKTALAAGGSGTLYAAWRHVYPGNLRDIAFSISRDAGHSFRPPVRISEDGWAINGCPDDGPALAIGSDGEAHVVWPTVLPGDTPEAAIFYASTRDGRQFTPRVRVPTPGTKPSHPQIVVDRSGRLLVAWDDSVSGQRTAAVREIQRGADGGVAFGPVVPLAPAAPGSSPVLAPVDGGVIAVWTSPGNPSRVMTRRIHLP